LWPDNRENKLAYHVFEQFHSAHYSKKVDYEEFMYSNYFDAFVKFANYMLRNNIVEPKKFIDFVIKHGIRLDDWATDVTYELYIRSFVENEPARTAMIRNIEFMRQWAEEEGAHWTEFFSKVSPGMAVHYVKTGRISPWVLYTLDSAQEQLLSRMSPEQLKLVTEQFAPLAKWRPKFSIRREDVDEVRHIFGQAGL
jgi:hypothetical protein